MARGGASGRGAGTSVQHPQPVASAGLVASHQWARDRLARLSLPRAVDFAIFRLEKRRGHVDDERDERHPSSIDNRAHEPGAPPTAKMRNAAQQEVSRLLDALAPESAPNRRGSRDSVERHRTPRGCILQAPGGAVSASWFADSAQGSELGELQIVAWRGTVSRPGSSERSEGAELIEELVLRPVENRDGIVVWHAADGTVYTTNSLVAHCLDLLAPWTASASDGER